MQTLMRGQKIKLADITRSQQLQVALRFDSSNLNFDFSCFGLDESGKLADERYFVFYNQLQSPENALRLTKSGPREAQFIVDLARLPGTISRLVFVATIDGAGTMSDITHGQIAIGDSGVPRVRFIVQGSDFGVEKALMVAEIYKKGEWRIAANGQGFAEGLKAVLEHFGGEVEETAPTPPVVSPAARSDVRNVPPEPRPPLRPTPAPPRVVPPPAPVDAGDVCVRCNKKVGVWEHLRGFNSQTKQCAKCEREVQAALEQFRRDFLVASASGILHDANWQAIWTRFDPTRQKMSHSAVLEFIRPNALQFVERLTTMAAADGVITSEEEAYIEQMIRCLEIPAHLQTPIKSRLNHVKAVTRIREGHLPRVTANHHLDAGEICHLETNATFHKVNTRSVSSVSGKLVATSKKLLFLAPTGGSTIQYKNIMRVEGTHRDVYLELATKSGNGSYTVPDALWTEAVLTTLTRMAKRQLLSPRDDSVSRHIPQDVRLAVWQRDGGQCVQCKDTSYLEFDHVIPHSKGGANTLGNVQLLCRGCNLAKGDRI
jgi:stress response protein SCP2/5-methylcytosine-specific restriction endonuclease McrA